MIVGEMVTRITTRDHLNKFSGVLNWAVEEGYLDKSPAKGLRLPDPVKKRDKRRPFSIEQLRRIFNSPLYTGCVDDVYGYAKVGDARPRRARFWIPLIALFSGMRMNEICQLKVSDIRTLDGVQCFVVIEDGDKRVKTAASERAIPIHQELIRIGFLAFVDEQRAAGLDLYRLYTAPERVSDIALQAGEKLVAVSAGDTVRWIIGDTTSGAGDAARVHVLVKPFAPGLVTNMVITTDRRAYHLALEAPMRRRWRRSAGPIRRTGW